MCFIHVLLNALDLNSRGAEACIVIEGAATGLVPMMSDPKNLLHGPYRKAKEAGLIHGVCRVCSMKTNVLEAVRQEGLPLADEMSGHAGMAPYIEAGYTIITF